MFSLCKNCELKRKISWLLAFITFFMFFISGFSVDVMADDASTANSLQQNYINLMGGSKLTDASSVSNIRTTDDLRNIALFLSNAYVPFYTSLDGDSEEANKENMTSMLKLIGFDENAAKEMTDMTYSASLNSATQLYVNWDYVPNATACGDTYPRLGMDLYDTNHYSDYFIGVATLGNSTYKKAVNDEYDFKDGKYTPFTVFEFQMLMEQYCNGGNGSWYCNYANDTNNDKEKLWSEYHGIPLYSMINGEPKVVFVLNNYVMAMLTTLVKEEADGDAKNGKLCNKLINGDIGEISEDMRKIASLVAFTQNIYIDWVGNVLCDLGDQRVILCPAYLNPCTFTKVDNNGKYDDYNGLGVLPIRYMNKYGDKDSSKKEVSFNYSTSLKYRLSDAHSDIAFDTSSWKIDPGDGGKFLDIINKLGLTAPQDGAMKNNDASGFQQYITYRADTTINSGDLCNFLQYKTVKKTSDTDASSFVSANLLDDFSFLKYFSSMPKFSSDDSLDYVISFSSSDKQMLQNIFLTYTFAYCNKNATSYSADTNYVDMKFNDLFPNVSDDITWESTSSTADEVLSFVYYLLHPSKGIAYVATWLKNKLSGIFVGWHEDIVGSTDSNSTTGMTHYLGFSGYVTTPSLYDIDWIANILNSYNSIIVYILIIMAVILLAYIIIGTMTVQRAILGFFMFAILAFLPPVAINTTMNIINTTSDKIYSSKFDYWALCQIEQYISQLSEIENADTGTDYVKQLLEMNKISNSNTDVAGESENSYSGVKLKWLSPKRFNELSAFSDEVQDRFDSSGSGLTSVTKNWLVNGQTSASGTEMYLRSDSVGYLYRDILDIYKYASISYQAFDNFGINDSGNATKWYDSSNTNLYKIKTVSGKDFYKYLLANNKAGTGYSNLSDDIKETSSISYMQKGFLVPVIDSTTLNSSNCNYYDSTNNVSATSLLLKYNLCDEVHKSLVSLNSFLESNSSLNITVDNFSNKSIIFGIEPSKFNLSVNDILTSSSKCTQTNLNGFYYALYSESPFYFFNYNIRDQISKFAYGYNYNYNNLTGSSQHIKDMFLDKNQEYFFNLTSNSGDGYGELRDFMNMHDLFYYIIPALQEGNDLVNTFNNVFNLTLYDDMPVKVNESGSLTYSGEDIDFSSSRFKEIFDAFSDEQKYKFWHNYNVRTVYNCYSSWLNLMSACDYANEEDITVAGKKFKVLNPLDPTSYYNMDDSGKITSGRYMVFSRSEMKYYGLGLDDLTTVERKIIEVQDNVYKDTIELMNYYTLSDETIIQGYTMIQLFNFNKAFSQESFISEDIILYPQSYELKAFTYDAYLRLIIAGSADEDLMTSGYGTSGNTSIYQRVLEKTSIFFGIVLIANDFIAVYVIPALKLFFLLIIFFLSILIIIASAIKMEMNILNVVWKSLLSPLLAFGGVSIGLAWLVSKFMSEGAQGVTKTDTVISLGDPTMVILVMLVINIVVLVLYWKICKKCFKDFKKFVTAVFNNALGAVSGALGKVVGTVTAGKVQGKAAGKAMGYSTAKQRGADNNPTSGKSGLGFGKGLATGAGLGIGAKVGSELAEGATSGSNRYDDKTSLGRAMNDKVNKADNNISRAEEAKKNTDKYQSSKENKALDKLGKKEAKINNDFKNAKSKAYKNRDKSQANSVLGVKNSDAYKKAQAKHEKRTNKLNKQMDKVGNKANKSRLKADNELTKAYTRASALKASGLNRYKVAAVAGIAGKATAKAMGGAVKGTAKVGTKVAKNSARAVKSGVDNGVLTAGAIASALGNNISS